MIRTISEIKYFHIYDDDIQYSDNLRFFAQNDLNYFLRGKWKVSMTDQIQLDDLIFPEVNFVLSFLDLNII